MMWVVLCKCIIGCVHVCICVAGRCPNMQFLKLRSGSQVVTIKEGRMLFIMQLPSGSLWQ